MKKIIIIFLLAFNMPVNAQPSWSVNNALYNLDGSIVVSITINGVLSDDGNDLVGAFDLQGNCRGVSSISLSAITGTYNGYLTVVGSKHGEKLVFKVYDASEGKVYNTSNDPVDFESNLDLGDLFAPINMISSSEEILSVRSHEKITMNCYPNPVQDFLTFSYSDELEIMRIELIGVNGVVVKHFDPAKKRFDLRSLFPGVYFLSIDSAEGRSTKKIIKK